MATPGSAYDKEQVVWKSKTARAQVRGTRVRWDTLWKPTRAHSPRGSPQCAKGGGQLEAPWRFFPALLVCNWVQCSNFIGRRSEIQSCHVKYPVRELTCTFSYTCAKNLLQRKLQPCSHVSRFPFHTSAHLDLVINTFCYSGVWNEYSLISKNSTDRWEKVKYQKGERLFQFRLCWLPMNSGIYFFPIDHF